MFSVNFPLEKVKGKYFYDYNFDLIEDDIAIVNGAFFFQIGKNKMIQEARIAYGGLYWCTLAIKNATETALKNKAWCQVWSTNSILFGWVLQSSIRVRGGFFHKHTIKFCIGRS